MLNQLREEKPQILEEKDTKIAELQAEFIQADRSVKKLENDLRNMQVMIETHSRIGWNPFSFR